MILDILRTLDDGLGFLRPYAVVAHGKAADIRHQDRVGDLIHLQLFSNNIFKQHEIFQGFAKGTHNILIATKSAEDLDIPKASIVIRFVLLAQLSPRGFLNLYPIPAGTICSKVKYRTHSSVLVLEDVKAILYSWWNEATMSTVAFSRTVPS